MGWAKFYIEKLQGGETVQFRPRGNSMSGKVESGDLCTVVPVKKEALEVGDIVLCKVAGTEYLHLIKARQGDRFQIGNNRGRINGWIDLNGIFGRCIRVEKQNRTTIPLSDRNMHTPPPHLNLIVLRSPDIHKSAKFYQALGLLLTCHRHGSGPEHYSSEVSGLVFEIYPETPKSGPTSGTRIGFAVDAVDELIPLLIEAGGLLITPPADSEWGRRAVVKDLDGHLIELVTKKS